MPRFKKNCIRLEYPLSQFHNNTNTQLRQVIHFPDIVSSRINLICCIIVGRLLANNVCRGDRRYNVLRKMCVKPGMQNLRRQRLRAKQFQRTQAISFYNANKVILDRPGFSLLENLEAFLKHRYQIIVFKNNLGKNIRYRGAYCERQIYLLESDKAGFYCVLRKPHRYFKYRNLCYKCLRVVQVLKDHMCNAPCSSCFAGQCKITDITRIKVCKDCRRHFRGIDCFTNHLVNNVCSERHYCSKCNRDYNPSNKHMCELVFCTYCNMTHKRGLCYVQNKNKESSIRYNAMYFDIETIQLSTGELKPILLIVGYLNVNNDIKLEHFEIRHYANVVDKFIEFLLQYDIDDQGVKKYKFQDYVCIAHNLKGFDGIFVLNSLIKYLTPDIIYSGSKINLIHLAEANIRFLDSFNFVAAPLRNLSKMFGLSIKKTFFPYRLLREEFLTYNDVLPAKETYDTDLMRDEKEKQEFEIFYAAQQIKYRNKNFNLLKVLTKYCEIDVKVLLQAMEQFRTLVAYKTSFDPFEKDITLASICIRDFIKNHMLNNSIGIIPARGYFSRINQSAKALDYLNFMSFKEQTYIQHAGTAEGEFRLGPFHLDGISRDKKLIFNFFGCFYHGCQRCFNHLDYHQAFGVNMQMKHKETELREIRLKHLISLNFPDFTYVPVWEHEFDALKKTIEYKTYLLQKDPYDLISKSISERDFFFGGRTNAISFYAKADAETKIKYVDICSLYPYVNKYMHYPKGHPELIGNNFDYSPGAYFGIMACKILPPTNLFHPVLPYKTNTKLMFPLCRTCAKTENMTIECEHNDNDRCLIGEWCTPEIYLALSKGYVLQEIYCVLNFTQKFKYDNETQAGLFGSYINKWLRTKIEASGWPTNVVTEIDKQQFVANYLEREGIELDASNIALNEGMRSLGKLFCNSLWGRFGLNIDKIKTVIFDSNTVDSFFDLMHDNSKDVLYWECLNEERLLVAYRNLDQFKKANRRGNVIIASFVSMWGRIELYRELERLNKRVLYMDTDSLIYTVKNGEYEPKLGSMLGQYTDEILSNYGEQYYISEFVATGPKSYGINIKKEGDDEGKENKSVIKIKGITQNLLNATKLSFSNLKKHIENIRSNGATDLDRINVIRPINFVRDKFKSTITNKPGVKVLTLKYNKRVRKDGLYITYPYGYKACTVD